MRIVVEFFAPWLAHHARRWSLRQTSTHRKRTHLIDKKKKRNSEARKQHVHRKRLKKPTALHLLDPQPHPLIVVPFRALVDVQHLIELVFRFQPSQLQNIYY